MPHRYRPENLKLLCEATGFEFYKTLLPNSEILLENVNIYRFTVPEMKRIYRGFKTDCPTGLITEEAFHAIYSRFFPHGGINFSCWYS
jgi:hypothetical protein